MSNGFGTINARNINEIVASLAKQIKDIKTDFAKDYTVLNNKLEKCEEVLKDLKDYIDTVEDNIESEYHNLQTQIEKFDEEIAEIRAELSQVNYRKIGNETVAVGIAPLSAYSATSSTYPFSAKYAVNDSDGNNIVETYATKVELGNTSATLSADYTQKIAESSSEGMSALSSVSGQLVEHINNEAQERQSKDEDLEESITNEKQARESADTTLQTNIENEVNRATDSEQFITDNLTGEITRSMGADNEISTTLTNEITRSTNRDDLLQQNINSLSNSVNDKESALNTKIEAETTRATTKESDIETALSIETTNRTSADLDLQTQIDAEVQSRINEIDSVVSAINAEEDRASQAEETLDSKIDSSVETINETISNLNTTFSQALTQEQTTRSTADTNLQTAITNEATTRNNADTALQTNINDEVSARASADTQLQTNITTEETTRISADNILQTNINNEISARTDADNNLQSQIDTIEATQNIVDIVGTKTELDDYDTTNLKDGAKIQVLDDESQSHASTIYQFNKYAVPNPTFGLVGTFGSYYTKAETESIVNSAKNELNTIIGTETTNRTNADTALSDRIDTLNNTKQNNLTAGDGIAIANDVVSHSIKIIENNNQEDTVEGTVFTVHLKNNHYKIITFDKTITEIKFMIEQSPEGILQETGFEFTVPEDSDLDTLSFEVIDLPSKKIYTIIPDSYTPPNIYQGTIVNYRCTIGEYEVED